MNSSPVRPAHGLRSHWTLLLLLLTYTMSFTDRQVVSILLQPIKQEFHVSDTAMGLLGGLSFALFYSVLAIPAGRYADRANRRNFIALCCGIWSAMTVVCGMATGYGWLFLARVGVAVGEAGGSAPSLAMIADHYPPQQRGRAMSVYTLGPQLGILLGLGLGGWIAFHYGWRDAFLWMGVPGAGVALLLRLTGVEPQRGHWEGGAVRQTREPLGQTLRTLWASPTFMRIALACLLMGFAGYGIGIWTPAFLVRSHHMTLETAGAVMGLLGGLGAIAGTLLSGWLCDVLGQRDARWRVGVPLVGSALSLPCVLVFYSLPASAVWTVGGVGIPYAVVAYALFAITAVWWTGPVYAVLAELIEPQRRATVLAVFGLALTLVGAGLGPLVVGMVSDALTASQGQEALRWALILISGISYVLGVWAFASTLKAYAAERASRSDSARALAHAVP